eukprot:scaffold212267_cov28-Tisochrysis_lutea.AAC.4
MGACCKTVSSVSVVASCLHAWPPPLPALRPWSTSTAKAEFAEGSDVTGGAARGRGLGSSSVGG